MKPDLIFDVGMNNGDDTAHYLSKGFRVVAIEADPTLVEHARDRFKEPVRAGQLELVNIAIGPDEGTAPFWVCEGRSEWNSFDRGIASRNGLPHHSITVQCRRFRDLLEQYGTPFYLKIDIEGHDHYCVEDLDPGDLPQYISLEMIELESLFKLRDLGYTRFKLITQNDHSHLSVDVFGLRELVKRRLRSHQGLYRVGRRFADVGRAAWSSVPRPNSHSSNGTRHDSPQFPPGSSGPFGEDTDGSWQTLDDVAHTWVAFQLGNSRFGRPNLNNVWHDVHAARLP